jgi:hypothetical protein
MIAHDDALVPALVSAAGDVEPFAELLATRIERANSNPTWGYSQGMEKRVLSTAEEA